jgi:outer membrane receptor protein involved in Fe transport
MSWRLASTILLFALIVPGRTDAQTTEPVALPATVVYAPTPLGGDRAKRQDISLDEVPRTRVYVSPAFVQSVSAADDRVPGNVSVVDANQIKRTDSLNVTDALRQFVPGLITNEVAGNPFQPDVEFRGFVASPVSGTPQGLAVYQNGVRINEAFGDTVNWDLIPTAAIRSITVSTNNPAFGLNALGGALNVQMKNGFGYFGTEADLTGGSFGRLQGSLQWGKRTGDVAVYGALEGLHDDGFRNFSATDIARFYGDVGYKGADSEVHMNLGAGDSVIGATGTVPVQLLQQYYGATYTTPQSTHNQAAYLNVTATADVAQDWAMDGLVHVRRFQQRTVDGNPTETQPCLDPALLCFGDNVTPAFGLDGIQLANPFPAGAILGEIDRTTTVSSTVGAAVQATNSSRLFDHANHLVVGSSIDYSISHFGASAELGTVAPDYVVTGSDIFLGPSGNPVTIGPVAMRSTNLYTGLYALDTLDVTSRLSLTAGGRLNVANIDLEDQLGGRLNGNNNYMRVNPLIGGTYKINPTLTAYAGYSESNRTPTPLELGCADPAHPCLIAAFLVSDPPLKQVVSKSVEAGIRGSTSLDGVQSTLTWRLGAFRTITFDDILAIPTPAFQGFGFFQNVGSTLRQGIEVEFKVKKASAEFCASYTFVDARFLDYLSLSSNSPFANANGVIQVVPGDQIPAIPQHRFKVGLDFVATDKLKVGGDALLVGSQYFVGDGSNQAPKLPPYAVFNLHGSYQIDKTIQLIGRIDNLFDNRYATYGTFFSTLALPDFANGGAAFTDPRSVSPARPRAFYAGLHAVF